MSAVQACQPARAPLAMTLILSVVVHVGTAGGVASVFAVREFIGRVAPWLLADGAEEKAEKEDKAKDPAEADDPAVASADQVIWVNPGIDDSTSETPVWIGFKDETEHVAFTASVDQSAMTPEVPGMRGEADSIAMPTPPSPAGEQLPAATEVTLAPTESTPTPEIEPLAEAAVNAEEAPAIPAPPPAIPDQTATTTEPAPAPPAPSISPPEADAPEQTPVPAPPPPVVTFTPEATPVERNLPEREEPREEEQSAEVEVSTPEDAPVPVELPAPRAPTPPSEKESEAPAPTPPPVKPEVDEPKPKATGAPSATTPRPGATPVPVPAGNPGVQSDKEADATSIKKAVDYRYGRVRAGEGIDIKTVKPEFSNFTILTALPRIPIVEITFTTKGKVKNVRMVQSSGYKDVDEPILNAVWAWSAKGKKLEALAKQNPNALLKISVRMLL